MTPATYTTAVSALALLMLMRLRLTPQRDRFRHQRVKRSERRRSE